MASYDLHWMPFHHSTLSSGHSYGWYRFTKSKRSNQLLSVAIISRQFGSHAHVHVIIFLCYKHSLSLQQTRNCVHECTHYLLGRETNPLLVQRISIKWDKPLGQTTGWLRTRLSSHKSLLAWFSHQVEKRSWNRRWCRAASRAVKILFKKNLFP